MSEEEQAVIEAAIEFTRQWDNGLMKDRPLYRKELQDAVYSLLLEHDGRWDVV